MQAAGAGRAVPGPYITHSCSWGEGVEILNHSSFEWILQLYKLYR